MKRTDRLKEIVVAGVNRRNPSLLRSNPGIAKIIDKCLRHNPDDRYHYAENLIAAIEVFDPRNAARIAPERLSDQGTLLAARIAELSTQPNNPFLKLASVELDKVIRKLEAMTREHTEIVGEREDLIDSLLMYLSSLGPGDEYLTVTAPTYWSEANLGINGRFLTMNKVMALQGVAIRRVFLLCPSDRQDPKVLPILEAHLRAVQDLSPDVDVTEKSVPPESEKSFYTGYVQMTAEERDEELSRGQHVAMWRKAVTGDTISITFSLRRSSDDSEETIGKIRFWAAERQEDLLATFTDYIERSRPLESFISLKEIAKALTPAETAPSRRKNRRLPKVSGSLGPRNQEAGMPTAAHPA